jgi:hypothetical protein
MNTLYTCWFTKSNQPKDNFVRAHGTKIHFCDPSGNKTLCGIKIYGGRWYLMDREMNEMKVDCKYCLKIKDSINE